MQQQIELFTTLEKRNHHVCDDNIQFDEPTHKYTIIDDSETKYTSVTTWNHYHFPQFDSESIARSIVNNPNKKPMYKNMTVEEIKDKWNKDGVTASSAGTAMHYNIECFMNLGDVNKEYTHSELYDLWMKTHTKEEIDEASVEWKYFLDFVEATPQLIPYRTEWSIYDKKLKLAGQIDMVYFNPDDGTISIYDWKRAKDIQMSNNFNKFATNSTISHIPDTNFWHYSLQLNTYKAILERNYGLKVRELFLVKLHPNNKFETFEIIKCADLTGEINELFNDREKIISKQKR
jgi:ATP-dependent exoDNAse (exonuclease V) beta subunit